MSLPDPGPLSARDYVDAMWFRSEKGEVLAAGEFRSDGKVVKEQVDGVKKAAVEPKFQARIDAGMGAVYPMIHSKMGFVYEGAPVVIK